MGADMMKTLVMKRRKREVIEDKARKRPPITASAIVFGLLANSLAAPGTIKGCKLPRGRAIPGDLCAIIPAIRKKQ